MYPNEWDVFFAPGLDLVPEIAQQPTVDLLRAHFEARHAHWPHPFCSGYLATFGNFDKLTRAVEPDVAFRLLPPATALLLEQGEKLRIISAGWLLLDLVRRSGTTEMPPSLDHHWPAVMAMLDEARTGVGWSAKEGLCLLYTSPSPRDGLLSRMPSSA